MLGLLAHSNIRVHEKYVPGRVITEYMTAISTEIKLSDNHISYTI
jgi:hypothetical protein